jgi:demethylmenaquinone methyltransferase/2-methoxy-6-polyprenyl-1,4-benzoquinol methylase
MPEPDIAPGRPTSERVRGIFSKIAGRYDVFNAMASMGIDRSWRRELVRTCALTPSSRVLDLASGTGDVAFALANLGHPAEVVATDFVPEMLAVAETKAAENPPAVPVSFSVADAQELPFDDESFDVATVAFGVRNFPDRPRNFAEVLRVLKPGGRYVILEFSRPTFAPWRRVYHVYLRHAIPAIGGMLTGDRDGFVYLNDSIRQFPTQPALAAELRQAGFQQVSWKDLSGGIVALHTAVK